MFLNRKIMTSTKDCSAKGKRIKELLQKADAVMIGAGAGLSASAGFTYSGQRFEDNFPDFIEKYDNEEAVRRMFSEQRNMKIPSGLLPKCPVCGAPVTMNLRQDDLFVQDEGWYAAAERYSDYIRRHKGMRILFLELGVGGNTPGIIKYPFWQMTAENPRAVYACVNDGEAVCPREIEKRSICINGDIGEVLK